MRKPLKILLLVLLVLVLAVGGYVIYVFASYDRIEDNQVLDVNRPEQTAAGASQSAQTSPAEAAQVPIGETLSLTSWNIGFGAYTDDYSFFMDGGKYSRAFSASAVVENLTAIGQKLADFYTDFSLIQEVDIAATRSYQVDERAHAGPQSGRRPYEILDLCHKLRLAVSVLSDFGAARRVQSGAADLQQLCDLLGAAP